MSPPAEISRLLAEYRRSLQLERLEPANLDYTRLVYHVPLLERLDAVEGSSVALFDLYKMSYVFLTSSFKFLLGYRRDQAMEKGPEYFYDQMHPDDLPIVLDTVSRSLRFLHGLSGAERKDYTLSFDFRMRQAGGGYVRLVQQVIVLEQDRRGAVWLILIVNDIVKDGSLEAPTRRQLRNIRNGKMYLFVPEEEPGNETRPSLTRRELEVLGLVAVGMVSREIADRLFISVATVNNHRQHILEKMGAKNCAEAVRYAAELGLL
ncbi:MAG: LuxR C-terminal-related transcriptional regulator [Spirochaetia bacterium]|jgi:DNA-binding CsgD family transcriptional regulator/PAS domain-containing protein